MAPTDGGFEHLVWRVSDDVSLVHQGSDAVYLTDEGNQADEKTLRGQLDTAQARRLLQVLMSSDGWGQQLQRDFTVAAAERRLWLIERVDRHGGAEGRIQPVPRPVSDVRRRGPYEDVVQEFGRASGCEVPGTLPQLVLLQANEEKNNGGPWHLFGDDAAGLLCEACDREDPALWPAFLLVDLDRVERYDVRVEEYRKPGWEKPGMRAEVTIDGTVVRNEGWTDAPPF